MKRREAGFLIAKTHQCASRIFARMLQDNGLEINPAQGRVLFVLWEQGSMSIHELAKKVSLGKSTLTNTLDRLEEAGQLRRRPSAQDKRRILVELTPKNQQMHKLYGELSEAMTRLYFASFQESEIDRFESLLRRVLDNLEAAESA